MKLAEKIVERELNRLAPVLVNKALARREEKRPALLPALPTDKLKTCALAGAGCVVAVSLLGSALEAARIRRAVRRELKRALEPLEKELSALRRENEALRRELKKQSA